MAEPLTSAAIVGYTGLVILGVIPIGQGSQILKTLLAHPANPKTYALGRRAPPETSSNLSPIVSSDTSTWAASLKSLSPPPPIFFSGLGTTKAAAGSIAAQRAIDYDLNLELARAAKESGTKVYVLISAAGVSISSPFPYPKMKAELEEEVKKLDFQHTVIIKPGLLLGDRKESRPAEAASRAIANALGKISKTLINPWAQTDDVIGRCAVRAVEECLEGKREKGVWIIGQGDIIKIGAATAS